MMKINCLDTMLTSALDAENRKNSPKIDSKKILKNKYGSKYIF